MDAATPRVPGPTAMRAAVYRGRGRLEVEQRPIPALGEREALIEVSHCGVCGTDLHFFREGMARPGSIGGHEYAGRIAALGHGVSGFSVGDAVVGGPRAACGRCSACRSNRPSLCAERAGFGEGGFGGAFAELVSVHESQLVRVPEGLPLRAAALAEPLAVALHAITRSSIQRGERALVTGAGPLGLLIVAALRALGVTTVVLSEPAPLRRERAQRVGATEVCRPEDLAPPRSPFDVAPGAYRAAFECSGVPAAMESALAQLARGGTLVLVGTGLGRPTLDPHRVLLNELVVTGAYNYDADGFPRALELLASGHLPLDELIEPEDYPLEALALVLDKLKEQALAGKVLISPSMA